MHRSRFLAAIVVTLSMMATAPARATPFGARLTLAADPAHSVVVHWNSDQATDDRVAYGTSAAQLDLTATATDVIAQGGSLGSTFRVTLTGLSPATTYYYRLGPAGGPFVPTDAPLQLRTLPADPCAPLRVIVMGDNRADVTGLGSNPIWNGVLGEAMAAAPDLFINTGDMVKNGDNADEWHDFLADSAVGLATVPSAFVIGNHDGGPFFTQLFGAPGATDGRDYFSLDVGPAHVVVLSTEQGLTSQAFADMLLWLDADLTVSDRPWALVTFHRAAYTRGNHHSGEDDNGALNAALVPILDAHDVDLAVSGHSHNYERYAPSTGVDQAFGGAGRAFPAGVGNALPSPVPNGTVGTTYIVSGGAGALTTDVLGYTCLDAACTYCTGVNLNCDGEVFDNDKTGNVTYDGRHSFLIIDVEGDTLTFEAWATDAGNTAPPEIIDTFSMKRPICGLPPGPDGGDSGGAGGDPAIAPGETTLADGGDGGGGRPAEHGCGCGSSGVGLALAPLVLLRRRRGRCRRQ